MVLALDTVDTCACTNVMSDQESAGQRQDRGQHTNDQRRLRDTFENLRHQIFRQRTNMQSWLRFLDAIASLDLGYECKKERKKESKND